MFGHLAIQESAEPETAPPSLGFCTLQHPAQTQTTSSIDQPKKGTKCTRSTVTDGL